MTTDAYLGDGLYASYDGFQIRLYTERAEGTHEVFLDSVTLAALERFVADLKGGDKVPVSGLASSRRLER